MSYLTPQGFDSPVMPQIQFANPAFFGTGAEKMLQGAQQGQQLVAEQQRIAQLKAMNPLALQEAQQKVEEGRRQLMMPVPGAPSDTMESVPRSDLKPVVDQDAADRYLKANPDADKDAVKQMFTTQPHDVIKVTTRPNLLNPGAPPIVTRSIDKRWEDIQRENAQTELGLGTAQARRETAEAQQTKAQASADRAEAALMSKTEIRYNPDTKQMEIWGPTKDPTTGKMQYDDNNAPAYSKRGVDAAATLKQQKTEVEQQAIAAKQASAQAATDAKLKIAHDAMSKESGLPPEVVEELTSTPAGFNAYNEIVQNRSMAKGGYVPKQSDETTEMLQHAYIRLKSKGDAAKAQGAGAPAPAAPTTAKTQPSVGASGHVKVTTRAQYDALPPDSWYEDSNGVVGHKNK